MATTQITADQQGQLPQAPMTGSITGDIVNSLLNFGTNFLNADKQKRLAEFNAEQQQKLLAELQKASSAKEKQRILEEAIAQKEKSKRIPYYIAGGIALVGISLAVYFFVIKKK